MKRIVIGVCAALGLLAFACGGGGGQSQECKDYIICAEKTGVTKGSLDGTYGAMGTCWSTGVAASIAACTAACKAGIDGYKTAYPDAGC